MSTLDVRTPLGVMRLTEEQGMICRAEYAEDYVHLHERTPLLNEAERQLNAYFGGQLRAFRLPLRIAGTPFEQQVMRALVQIPYGQTRTYRQIAGEIGHPAACRAVGRACAHNRLLVLIPCHRVIAASGSLTGYAAGMERKRALLLLESTQIEEK